MLNWIWLGLILVAVVYGAFTGRMAEVSAASFEGAKDAVDLVIKLTGGMMLMLGLMRVAVDGGLLRWIARAIAPLMRRLFPAVPAEHPAMGAMVMNFATNILGMGNAATPFGLKAMRELEKLNPLPGVATDAMVLFLAINATAITLFPPTGTMMVLSAAGSTQPWSIWVPTLIATTCSTGTAVIAFYLLRRLPRYAAVPLPGAPAAPAPAAAEEAETAPIGPARAEAAGSPTRRVFVAAVAGALLLGLALEIARQLASPDPAEGLKGVLQNWLFPVLIAGLLLVGVAGGARVYESAIEGSKEGLDVGVRILPYMVAILAAVKMLRESGALDLVIDFVRPASLLIGVPGEVLPMVFLRPLSGSGAFAVMSEIVTTYGPESFIAKLACTLQGSTETTFYVLTVYFGASGTRNIRHTLVACLIGDVAGFLGATAACHAFFG